MATDRELAKKSITGSSETDPEFRKALSDAQSLQLELEKEKNRHNETMRLTDLGAGGRLLGGEKNAPTVVAGMAAAFGGVAFCGCLLAAARYPDMNEFWGKNAERALAFSAASIAYIFGRGTK
jgi:hypothetical protein